MEWVLTLAQAAEALEVDPGTLRRQIYKNRLAAVKHGRDWFVSESEIERYAIEQKGQKGRKRISLE